MSQKDSEDTKIKSWIIQNITWLFTAFIAIISLYTASLINPIVTQVRAMEEKMTIIESMGTPTAQRTLERVDAIKESISEIKDSIIRLEEKLDGRLERE